MASCFSPRLYAEKPKRNIAKGLREGCCTTIFSSSAAADPKVPKNTMAPARIRPASCSDVRIAVRFFLGTGMGHRAVSGGPNGLRIFPDRAGLKIGLARVPIPTPFGEFLLAKR